MKVFVCVFVWACDRLFEERITPQLYVSTHSLTLSVRTTTAAKRVFVVTRNTASGEIMPIMLLYAIMLKAQRRTGGRHAAKHRASLVRDSVRCLWVCPADADPSPF